MLNNYGFLRVDKKQLKPMSREWKRSAGMHILFPKDHRTWFFDGLQIDANDPREATGKVFVSHKLTGDIVNVSLVQAAVDSMGQDSCIQYEQPWDNDDVVVYKSDSLSTLMDAVLSQEIAGMQEQTIGSIIETMIKSGIPVFITGGAVRVCNIIIELTT